MELPCQECRGKCCTFPTFTKKEFTTVKATHGLSVFAVVRDLGAVVVPHLPDGTCPYLKQGKCSVYDLRPQNCRQYGVVPQLPCMYLYPKEAMLQVNESAEKMLRDFK